MTTEITVFYDNPSVFEARYPQQVALARKVPRVERIKSARVWPKEDGSPTPTYRLVNVCYTDYAAASQWVATADAPRLFPTSSPWPPGAGRSWPPTSRRAAGASHCPSPALPLAEGSPPDQPA